MILVVVFGQIFMNYLIRCVKNIFSVLCKPPAIHTESRLRAVLGPRILLGLDVYVLFSKGGGRVCPYPCNFLA